MKFFFILMGIAVTLLVGCTNQPQTSQTTFDNALSFLSESFHVTALDRENDELHKIVINTGVLVKQNKQIVQIIMPSDIQKSNEPVLHAIAMVLKKYDKTRVYVTGYTDNVGNASYNLRLSETRAKSIGTYLIEQGVAANRVFMSGRGDSDPVAANTTENGRAMNRRVVVTLTPIS